jgi:hypothetical protein
MYARTVCAATADSLDRRPSGVRAGPSARTFFLCPTRCIHIYIYIPEPCAMQLRTNNCAFFLPKNKNGKERTLSIGLKYLFRHIMINQLQPCSVIDITCVLECIGWD